MKILFLISGDHVPSSRFRVLPFVPHLRAAGHRCTVAASFPQKYDYFRWLGWRPSQWLKRAVRGWHWLRAAAGNYDVIVLERELFHDASCYFERHFRRVAKRFVLDVDDAIFLNFPDKFPQLVAMADIVIAGNRLLQEHVGAHHKNVVVIPTCVDTTQYRPSGHKDSGRPIVGWMGTTGNVSYLEPIVPALRQLALRHEFELRVIAGERGALDSFDLAGVNARHIPWRGETEIEEISKFDIGLMPLRDDDWSRYKCGLKLLQYMAVGIPGVASPVGVNVEIVEPGVNGFLAESTLDWVHTLESLLTDAELRARVGRAARETVETRYSVTANLPKLIKALGGEPSP